MRSARTFLIQGLMVVLVGCTPKPVPGPDKQGASLLAGAALGAGTGAVYGAQVAAGTGPGAAVGAGLGLVFGALQGAGVDLVEDEDIKQIQEVEKLKVQLWTQEVLAEHYEKRLRLHPNRDIYPADIFFDADSAKLSTRSKLLSREIAQRARNSLPWSRILVTSYMTTNDAESIYPAKVSQKRAEQIALQFVKAGIEPRRIITRSVLLSEPLLADPDDSPGRYRQAIELIPLDY